MAAILGMFRLCLAPWSPCSYMCCVQATAEHYGLTEGSQGQARQLQEQQAPGGQAGGDLGFVPGTGEDAEAAAAAAFDAAVHQQYLDLAPWPQPTEEELKVGAACCHAHADMPVA